MGHVSRYEQLQARLVALSAERQALRRKSAQYKHLQQLLEPFKDPQVNVQPNLVTKDGELGKELDRMRVLIARVASGMVKLKESGDVSPQKQEEVHRELSSEEKLAAILRMQ